MRNRFLATALAVVSLVLAPLAAVAGPINGYPAATTPLSGAETTIGSQSGSTVQITTQSIANILLPATSVWTGVQTFPAPGAGKGSIVLTPGTVSGTPANGSLWTTSSGVFAQINGATQQLGNVTQTGAVVGGDCVEWNGSGVVKDAGIICGGSVTGSGVPGGPNTSLQFNNAGGFSGTANFTYATLSGVPTVTGPDGGVWNTSGFKLGSGKDLDINSGWIVSNSTPLIASPNCAGATWLIGPSTAYCSHISVGVNQGTDNIGIGTIVFDSITTGFGNTTAGSENMHLLTTGSYNSGFGFEALHDITTGSHNVAVGDTSAINLTTGSSNIALGSASALFTGSANLCIFACGAAGALTGSNNTVIAGDPSLTSGSRNIFVGVSSSGVGFGIATGNGNVAIGGQFASLSDQSDSITLADGDGHILLQYLTDNGYLSVKQPTRSTGNFAGVAATTVSGLTAADASPVAGDRSFVTDATSCTFNSAVTGGGSTKCPVVYTGTGWVAG